MDIANRLGGEIVRLWVASIDFREDMAASENLMQRCAEIYRKLRNTFRFLLGNLHGFDPARDRVAEAELLPLDRYMLARTRELTEKILDWYAAFEFHRVYHAVNEFAIVDLSSFYLDVLKDRMYTFAPTSQERRSAQTVLWQITEALVRLVAPILSFTADEVWEYLPAGRRPRGQRASGAVPQAGRDLLRRPRASCLKSGSRIFDIRDECSACARRSAPSQTHRQRPGSRTGNSRIRGDQLALLQRHSAGLKEIVNVSKVTVVEGAELARSLHLPATGHKCARCWNFMPEVANYGIWQNVCTRCPDALNEMNIAPPRTEAAQ